MWTCLRIGMYVFFMTREEREGEGVRQDWDCMSCSRCTDAVVRVWCARGVRERAWTLSTDVYRRMTVCPRGYCFLDLSGRRLSRPHAKQDRPRPRCNSSSQVDHERRFYTLTKEYVREPQPRPHLPRLITPARRLNLFSGPDLT